MKTILHTIDTNEPGGAETVFIDLVSRLPKDQYRPIVVICGKGWIYDQLRRRGIEPILLNTRGSFNWRYLKGLITLIRREKVDLIQSHLLGSNVYCSIAGVLTRKPVVATFHGSVDVDKNERMLGLKVGAVNFGAKCIIAVSDSLRKSIINREKFDVDKTQVIYNGIVTSDFGRRPSSLLREKFGWSENDVIIGSIGNIHPAKGYDVLLKAAAVLKDAGASYRFVIAGNERSGLYEELLKLRTELGLDNVVQFLGFYDDPAGFMSNIDMFLLPSISEGFSIATIEAMAASIPVIATKSGGPEEIITHGVNGWMIEPGSPEEIVSAIEKLAYEPALCEELAKKGREHVVQRFDMDAMLNSYEKVYRKLLN